MRPSIAISSRWFFRRKPSAWVFALGCSLALGWALPAFSQAGNQGLIVRDNSLGDLRNQIVPPGADAFGVADYLIQTSYGEQLGSTVFHSLSQFGVGAGEVAAFEFALGIDSYIVRVTGSDISRLDGQIRIGALQGQPTSLFVMNPNGFLFGPDAELNLGGSTAYFGAASSLEFVDGFRLLADENAPIPLIEVAPLADFGFLPAAQGDITIDGATLQPAFGLHLTAENVAVQNQAVLSFKPFSFPDRASLSIRATEDILIDGVGTNIGRTPIISERTSQFLESVVLDASRIQVSGGARIDASGINVQAGEATLPGRIELNASESISVVGVPAGQQGATAIVSLALDQTTQPTDEVGAIRLSAPDIEISGQAVVSSTTGSPGTGGGIEVNADTFRLVDGARIQSDSITFATGAAGGIAVNADSVLVSNGAAISTSSLTGADAGRIDVTANRIDLRDARVSTSATGGDGGDIRLEAVADIDVSGGVVSAAVDGGDGGNVEVEAGRSLVLRDDAFVLARAASAGGRGGEISLSAQAIAIEAGVTLDASAPGGPDAQGVVNISALALAADPSTETLTNPPFDSTRLNRSLCDLDVEASSFVASELTAHAPDSLDIEAARATNGGKDSNEEEELWLQAKQLARRTHLALPDTNYDDMATHGRAARIAAKELDSGRRRRIELNLARTWLRAAREFRSRRSDALLTSWSLLDDALRSARDSDDSRAIAYIWGAFAELYEADGRPADARRLIGRALELVEELAPDPSHYRLYWFSGRLAWRGGDVNAAVDAYQRALALEEMTAPNRSTNTRSENRNRSKHGLTNLQAIRLELIDLLLALSESAPEFEQSEVLGRVRALISAMRLDEIQNYFRDPCLGSSHSGRTPEYESDPHAAVIHLLPLPDRIEILVSRGSQIDRFTTPVQLSEVRATTAALEIALQKPFTQQFRRPAELLHEWLISPIEGLLRAKGVNTLIFSPAGVLTGIPFAALVGQDAYLVERYSIATSSGLGLLEQRDVSLARPEVLVAGLSAESSSLAALPGVTQEIDAIRSEFSGETLLNENFQIASLEAALERYAPRILHIASHGVLGETARQSFIETWDGHLDLSTLSRLIRRQTRSGQSLDLLVLSACETISGDERAAVGLAGVAVKAGARSVLGALWAVSDEATRSLMTDFYRALAEAGMSKADSLRRAQRTLLETDGFAHPYFWSGFVLANDWR